MENSKEMAIAAKYTESFSKPEAHLKYNGWEINVRKLFEILKSNGYTVYMSCTSNRHHAAAWAIKK